MASSDVESLLIEVQSSSGEWTQVGAMYSQRDSHWFESFSSYWATPGRPVLGQQFEERGRDWQPKTHAALPAWFSHLLPEGALRRETAAEAHINASREFQLLKILGADDLPGAVRATAAVIEHGIGMPIGIGEDPRNEESTSSPLLKFSLAGVQLKFSVARGEKGPTVPIKGAAGDSILKFPDGRPGFEAVPEAEFASMTLAGLAGIDTAPVSLADARAVHGLEKWANNYAGPSLLVSRFDRINALQRVHTEELAQVMGISATKSDAKYRMANFETIANFVAKLVGLEAVGQVIDRIVFNVLIGNGDAHLKNWSFVYPDGRHPQLSPAYDLVPTVLYLPDDDLGLNLNGSKLFSAVSPDSFDRLGAATGYGIHQARKRAADAVGRIRSQWQILPNLLSTAQYETLTNRLQSLNLIRNQ